MERYWKYILSGSLLVLLLYSCDQMSIESKLQYTHTSGELVSLSARLDGEMRSIYEGSLLKQAKWDTLIALNPENEEYYRRKSITHSRIGDYHMAFPLIEKAIRLDPYEALYFGGWHLLYMYRDYERALDNFSYYDDIAEGVNYIWGENINYLKGLAYKQMGFYDQAVEEFDKCISYEGENVDFYAFVYRGISNLRNECLEEAISDFDKALVAYPKCTMAHLYKGEALLYQNNCNEAMHHLCEAKDLLVKGSKKNHPYVEVFDEVHLVQAEDLLNKLNQYTN